MAPIEYESGLEPAPQDYPEVTRDGYPYYQHPNHHHLPQYPAKPYYPPPPPPPHNEPPSAHPSSASTYSSGGTLRSPLSGYAVPLTSSKSLSRGGSRSHRRPSIGGRTTICGCGLLVFILSAIIALLSAAVIALAATTGVQAQRANSAAAQLAAVNASAPAGATASAAIDGGCATNPGTVNKSVYTSFSLLNAQNFTRFCNRDAPSAPLLSLFTADFATCMDACAAYTKYVPSSFPSPSSNNNNTNPAANNTTNTNNGRNTTCTAVSFIPAWANKATAAAGGAPGNCYLKGGVQNETALAVPNIGVPVHAAIALPLGEN